MSTPALPGGAPPGVQGSVTLGGLSVELCDEAVSQCVTLADAAASVTVLLGDATADVSIARDEIPRGNFTHARVTATSAIVDLSLNVAGQPVPLQFEAPPDVPVIIEKSVEVIVNEDGSRTVRVEIEAVRTISVEVGTGSGAIVTIDGEVVTGSVGASGVSTATTSVDASEISAPPAVELSGSVSFEGLKVELWDGEQWVLVANPEVHVTLGLGQPAVETTLVPPSEMPEGPFSKVRITVGHVVLDLTVKVNDRQFFTLIEAPREPIVIEKDVELTVHPDGSRSLRIEIESIRTIAVQVDPMSHGAIVTVTGDLAPQGASALASG